MKIVDKGRMIHYRTRAKAFYDAMRLLSDDLPAYREAIGVLAIHSAISLSDAVLVAYTGQRSNDQDHQRATEPLERLCKTRKLDRDGLKHLAWLLRMKSSFAYDDRPAARSDIQLAGVTAQRFRAWTYRTFPEVAHEDDSIS